MRVLVVVFFALTTTFLTVVGTAQTVCTSALLDGGVPMVSSGLTLGGSLGNAPVLSMGSGQPAVATGTRAAEFLTFLLSQVPGGAPEVQLPLRQMGGFDLRQLENLAISPDRTRIAFSQRGNGTAPFYLFNSTNNELRSAAVDFDPVLAGQAWENIGSKQFALPEKLTRGGTDGVVKRMETQALGGSGIFPFRHMHFSPDGTKLVVDGGTVFSVFDAFTLELLYQFSPGLPVIGAAWFVGEGRFILTIHELGISGGNANTAILWQADNGKFLRAQTIDSGFVPTSLDGYGGTGGNIPGRGISTPDVKGRFWVRTVESFPGFGKVLAMQHQRQAVTPAGNPEESSGGGGVSSDELEPAIWSAVNNCDDFRETSVWTIGFDQQGPKLVKATKFRSSRDSRYHVAFSDVDRAAVATPYGRVEIFALPDWRRTHTLKLEGRDVAIAAVVISADGSRIAALTTDNHLSFWEVGSEEDKAVGLGYVKLSGPLERWHSDDGRMIRTFFSGDNRKLNIYAESDPGNRSTNHIIVDLPESVTRN